MPPLRHLSPLEQEVMELVWEHGPITSGGCRGALHPRRPLRESTVRTVLQRLENKGYVRHTVRGRTHLFRAARSRTSVLMRAVRQLIDRFCDGSAEQLVTGMVENAAFSEAELERLARRIAQKKAGAA